MPHPEVARRRSALRLPPRQARVRPPGHRPQSHRRRGDLLALRRGRARADAAESEVLARLLEYGERHPETGAEAAGALHLVVPRLGTISPWSSKATDIAHSCGLARGRAHRARHRLSDRRCAARRDERVVGALHDRMTETVLGRARRRGPALPPLRRRGRCATVPVRRRRARGARAGERRDGARARGRRDRLPPRCLSPPRRAIRPTSS